MKKIVFILLLFTTVFLPQSNKLSLKESIEIGLRNSKELRIAKSKLSYSEAKVSEITSQFLPQLKFLANYTRLSSVPPFEVNLPFSPVPIKISDIVLNNYALRFSFQQPLFTGFRLISTRASADLNNKAAEQDLIRELNEVSYRIQTAFWNFYKADQQLFFINENLLQTEKHLEDTREFLKNGLVTQNDLLKLEVQYSNTKLMKIDAENNLDIARMVFNQAIGLPVNSDTQIQTETGLTVKEEYSPEVLITEAKENRSDLKSMELKLEAAENGIKSANSSWFPSIYLAGNYYYNRPNSRYQPVKDSFKDSWDVGVSLNWDIWNWGLTSAQAAQAEQTRIQAEISLSQLKEAVEIEVYQNYLMLKRAGEKISVSEKNLEQAKENYRITKEKFNSQLATTTDLIDAESSLLLAETNLNSAQVDYQLAKAKLLKSVGRKIY